ncbi:MAG TPA: M23 family metallopeptidase, partial [Polyangiaceae bacterium]|nr:M23 family metallopeptidase [Polyangiaceae bacterium]
LGGSAVLACSETRKGVDPRTHRIPGVAGLVIPEGSLARGSSVELTAAQSPEESAVLSDTVTPLGARATFPRFVFVKTSAPPIGPMQLLLEVPGETGPEETYVAVRHLYSSDVEELPSFESEVSAVQDRQLVMELEPVHFRSLDGVAVAVVALVVPSTTSAQSQGLRTANHTPPLQGDPCPPGGFSPPIAGARINSGFGPRPNPKTGAPSDNHYGVDYSAVANTPVRAMADGVLSFAGEQKVGWGKFVTVKHGANGTTVYAHLKNNAVVPPGTPVRRGDVVGYSGATGGGKLTGPHLHVEYAWDNNLRKQHSLWSKVDPLRCMPRESDAGAQNDAMSDAAVSDASADAGESSDSGRADAGDSSADSSADAPHHSSDGGAQGGDADASADASDPCAEVACLLGQSCFRGQCNFDVTGTWHLVATDQGPVPNTIGMFGNCQPIGTPQVSDCTVWTESTQLTFAADGSWSAEDVGYASVSGTLVHNSLCAGVSTYALSSGGTLTLRCDAEPTFPWYWYVEIVESMGIRKVQLHRPAFIYER